MRVLIGLVAAVVVLGTACSPSNEEPSDVPANAAPSSAAEQEPTEAETTAAETSQPEQPPGEQVISVSVSGGAVNPQPGPVDVTLGSNIVIEVTADADDEVHVHGYDVTAQATAGQPTRIPIQATIPGQFEVELHDSGLLLFMLRVQ